MEGFKVKPGFEKEAAEEKKKIHEARLKREAEDKEIDERENREEEAEKRKTFEGDGLDISEFASDVGLTDFLLYRRMDELGDRDNEAEREVENFLHSQLGETLPVSLQKHADGRVTITLEYETGGRYSREDEKTIVFEESLMHSLSGDGEGEMPPEMYQKIKDYIDAQEIKGK